MNEKDIYSIFELIYNEDLERIYDPKENTVYYNINDKYYKNIEDGIRDMYVSIDDPKIKEFFEIKCYELRI